MTTIRLTQNQSAVVDDEDADLAAFKWHAMKHSKTFYAQRRIRKPGGEWTTEKLHQVVARRMGIAGAPDHEDRNGLNNRRSNLRPATRSQNNANKGLQRNSTSGFKGVGWHKGCGKWQARVKINGRRRCLGYFVSPVDAAVAYDRAALKHFGGFACPNFREPTDE